MKKKSLRSSQVSSEWGKALAEAAANPKEDIPPSNRLALIRLQMSLRRALLTSDSAKIKEALELASEIGPIDDVDVQHLVVKAEQAIQGQSGSQMVHLNLDRPLMPKRRSPSPNKSMRTRRFETQTKPFIGDIFPDAVTSNLEAETKNFINEDEGNNIQIPLEDNESDKSSEILQDTIENLLHESTDLLSSEDEEEQVEALRVDIASIPLDPIPERDMLDFEKDSKPSFAASLAKEDSRSTVHLLNNLEVASARLDLVEEDPSTESLKESIDITTAESVKSVETVNTAETTDKIDAAEKERQRRAQLVADMRENCMRVDRILSDFLYFLDVSHKNSEAMVAKDSSLAEWTTSQPKIPSGFSIDYPWELMREQQSRHSRDSLNVLQQVREKVVLPSCAMMPVISHRIAAIFQQIDDLNENFSRAVNAVQLFNRSDLPQTQRGQCQHLELDSWYRYWRDECDSRIPSLLLEIKSLNMHRLKIYKESVRALAAAKAQQGEETIRQAKDLEAIVHKVECDMDVSLLLKPVQDIMKESPDLGTGKKELSKESASYLADRNRQMAFALDLWGTEGLQLVLSLGHKTKLCIKGCTTILNVRLFDKYC